MQSTEDEGRNLSTSLDSFFEFEIVRFPFLGGREEGPN
jgi:hypothetical protein